MMSEMSTMPLSSKSMPLIAERYLAPGATDALIFGTTNVPEFAAGGITTNPASGQTRNPYGHNLTVGGSSGGSGAAVAGFASSIVSVGSPVPQDTLQE